MINFYEVIMELTTIEVIIGGALTAIASILGALINNTNVDRKINAQINSKIGDVKNSTLSGHHEAILEKISVATKKQSEDHKVIDGSINRVSLEVKNINTIMKINQEREKGRYSSLSDSQKRIDFQIEGIKSTIAELNRLQIENHSLKSQIIDLEAQLKYLNKQHGYDLER